LVQQFHYSLIERRNLNSGERRPPGRLLSSEAAFFAIATQGITRLICLGKSGAMSIFSTLRGLARQEASMDDMHEFQRQVRLESNDRGATLLVTANCDLALTQAIYRVLKVPDDFRQKLEAEGGPLNTFSQKIMMGRAYLRRDHAAQP
jgi:hypothetical protein